MTKELRIGALISGGGTNLQAIIDACESGKISGQMVFVGTDNPGAKGLSRARHHGIPEFVADYGALIRDYRQTPDPDRLPADFNLKETIARQTLLPHETPLAEKEAFFSARAFAEARLLEALGAFEFDLLVLAGFMRTLSPYFIDRVNRPGEMPRIMNIHPALLPAFPGTDGYGDTYRHGCKVGGCTVHFIDYGEDSGPIIGQKAFAIEPADNLDTVKAKGLKEEWALYPVCIELYARGRLQLRNPEGDSTRTVVKILPH